VVYLQLRSTTAIGSWTSILGAAVEACCGTVLKVQLLALLAVISTSANGVVTTRLSFLPPPGPASECSDPATAARPPCSRPGRHGLEYSRRALGSVLAGRTAALCGPKLRFCGVWGNSGSRRRFCPSNCSFCCHKILKTRAFPLSKAGLR
jgi:hypothetical protein